MKTKYIFITLLFTFNYFNVKTQTISEQLIVDTLSQDKQQYISVPIVKQISNHHLLYIRNYGTENYNHLQVAKFDSIKITKYTIDGNEIWETKLKLENGGKINDFIETPEHDFILSGEIDKNNSIIKIDSNGNVLFIKNYILSDSLLENESIIATNDGNYLLTSNKFIYIESIACPFNDANNVHKYETYLTKINKYGVVIWNTKINECKIINYNYSWIGYVPPNQYEYKNSFYKTFIDFYNNDSVFNVIKINKVDSTGFLHLKIISISNNGNIIQNKNLVYITDYKNNCFGDAQDLPFEITNDGYSFLKVEQSSAFAIVSLKKLLFNKNGLLIDSIVSNITNQRFLGNIYGYYYYMQLGQSNCKINSTIHTIRCNPFFSNNNNSEFLYINSNDQYTYEIQHLYYLDDTTSVSNTSNSYIFAINDSTLLLTCDVMYSDSIKYLKFYHISLNSNKIEYSIYIDKNNNGIYDNTDTIYSNALIEISTQNTTRNFVPFENGKFTHLVSSGNYISKLISYNQTLKYYTVLPIEKLTIFTTTTRGIDSITFRLIPKPNIQDLQVSIVPLIGARPGFNASYKIIAKNVGTKTIVHPIVKFIKDTFQTFEPTSYSIDADTLFWNLDSLTILEQQEIIVTVKNAIPPTLNANDTLHLIAQIFPMVADSFLADNIASLNQLVVNSIDPNDKIETHGGNLSTQEIQNRDYLYYTIRFQNTGNSYASRIIVTDTLSENLDWSTLEMLSMSHQLTYSVTNRKYITWKNENTYLPDSTSDEANSHGYISFRIKPKAGLIATDVITNRASIVFDYNAAITTNTCLTKIIEQRILSIKNKEIKSIKLYPNPTTGNIQVEVTLTQTKNYSITILDINGQVLMNEKINGNIGDNKIDVNLLDYANGLYFIQLADETGNLFYGKIVKQ